MCVPHFAPHNKLHKHINNCVPLRLYTHPHTNMYTYTHNHALLRPLQCTTHAPLSLFAHPHMHVYTYAHFCALCIAPQGRQLHPRKDSSVPDYPSWFDTDHWPLLGEFTAANRKGSQAFKIPLKRRIR